MIEQEPATKAVPDPPPFQFSLRQLLLAFVALSVAFGVFPYTGIAGVVFCLASAGFVVGIARRKRAVCAGSVCVAIVMLPFLGHDPDIHARRAVCTSNLISIGKALEAYHMKNGRYPPAYIADENGRPMHSWRVLLLPYLDCKSLYDAYDFTEPWDGPNNSRLAAQMPPFYACPSDPGALGTNTSYLAVVGPGMAWPGTKSVKSKDFGDGRPFTIWVVEAHNTRVNWMSPQDLDVATMTFDINSKSTLGISSRHPRGALVLMADRHVEFLRNEMLPEEVYALLTANQGDRASLP